MGMTSGQSVATAGLGDNATPDGWATLSPEDFKRAFRNHPAGVAIITADPGDGPVGLTATSVFSVSAEPPLFVFSISSNSSSAPALAHADTVVVHLLAADQLDAARLFATSGVDRFADADSWSRLDSGEPFLHGTGSWLRGRIINRMDAGNSTVIAVHAIEAAADASDTAPLVYHNRAWHSIGSHSQLSA